MLELPKKGRAGSRVFLYMFDVGNPSEIPAGAEGALR